jgi:hypothetical protein
VQQQLSQLSLHDQDQQLNSVLLPLGYKHIEVAKTAPLAYLTTVTVFVLGAALLREPVFFTDFLGSLDFIKVLFFHIFMVIAQILALLLLFLF